MPRATSSTPPGTMLKHVDPNFYYGSTMIVVVTEPHPSVSDALRVARFVHEDHTHRWGIRVNRFNIVEDPDARG